MEDYLILILLLAVAAVFAGSYEDSEYTVVKLQQPVEINAVWDKAPWNSIQELTLSHYMGAKPKHMPKVYAKVAYDDEAIYVIFKVEDQYVIARAKDYLGRVWEDSCVEFFFTPDEDSGKGYFNLEMNCGGTVYFQFQTSPGENVIQIARSDFDKITIAHSLPKIVNPEMTEPTTWYVEYRMPISILENYINITRPAPGVKWRANLNKCADQCSHPHWLTWAKIDYPTPAFHKPFYFGVLTFSDAAGIASQSKSTPAFLRLEQNYPNPFNSATTIEYGIDHPMNVNVSVYDTLGRRIVLLDSGLKQPGIYKTTWNPGNAPSGVYFCCLEAGGHKQVRKMVLAE